MAEDFGSSICGSSATGPSTRSVFISLDTRKMQSRKSCFLYFGPLNRSEEHTSELQSLMRISYAVFCLKKKRKNNMHQHKLLKHQQKHIQNNEHKININITNVHHKD